MQRRASLAIAVCLAAAAAERQRFEAAAEIRGCRVVLEAPEQQDTLRLRTSCPLTVAELGATLRGILEASGPELAARLPVSLDFGRVAEHPWLVERLAASAWTSPTWDVNGGRPREGDVNRFVADLLSERRFLAEIEEVCAARGLALRVAGVEKVLVGRVAETDELRELTARGIDGDAHLPFDAILWLRIEALAGAP